MSRRKLPRVVVDTNIIISAIILKQGAPYQLLQSWKQKRFRWLISQPQRVELEEVIRRPKLVARYGLVSTDVNALLRLLDRRTYLVEPTRSSTINIRDPKDEKILYTALAGPADYLVTGDKDLMVLANNPKLGKLKILRVVEFLKILK